MNCLFLALLSFTCHLQEFSVGWECSVHGWTFFWEIRFLLQYVEIKNMSGLSWRRMEDDRLKNRTVRHKIGRLAILVCVCVCVCEYLCVCMRMCAASGWVQPVTLFSILFVELPFAHSFVHSFVCSLRLSYQELVTRSFDPNGVSRRAVSFVSPGRR